MVFPGQGSQAVGMLHTLAADFPIIQQTYAQASDVVGFDLWKLTQYGPAEELNQTQNTQPTMLAAGYAVYQVWRQLQGPTPSMLAGHSLGEYTALAVAGSIAYEDAIALVYQRGLLMKNAVPEGEGSMAAIIGLDDEMVIQCCRESAGDQVVEAANYNSPGQLVIAGHKAAVARAMQRAQAQGAKRAIMLPVSVPSHCTLMQAAAEQFAHKLASVKIQTPKISIVHNVDAQTHHEPNAIRAALREQLCSPVRWSQSIQSMQRDHGIGIFVECGPGKVLAGLIKRILQQSQQVCIEDEAAIAKAKSMLAAAA